MKRFFVFLMIFVCIMNSSAYALEPLKDEALEISCPSAVLMEKSTETLLYEKDAHCRLFPASVTKVMTMLLIVEEMEAGRLAPEDIVTASSRAASFGGSCVYLEEGEQMSVRDMLKCIAVVSANDCAVAMAEHISGTEAVFVEKMNKRAKALGLADTNFTNCSGLFDDGKHYTSAYDTAVLSAELMKHDMIKEYTTIWMDSIRNGEFALSNTNKLVYWYPGCTGLKTGYTSTSMYCLSATAERGDVEYIAVVMHGESSDARNEDAKTLLNYAFANFALCPLRLEEELPTLPVDMGKAERIALSYGGAEYAVTARNAPAAEYSLDLPEKLSAPIYAGDTVGTLYVKVGGQELTQVPVVAAETVPRLSWLGILGMLAGRLIGL